MMVTSPAIDTAEASISNDGFYPDIDLASMRADQRIDGTVPTLRLRAYIINAVLTVNRQLKAFKARQLADGVQKLVDIEAEIIEGKNTYYHYYLRAIGSLVKAEILENYRDFDTTTAGRETADELTPNIDELRRNAYWSIADMLDTPHTNVELI